MSVPRLSLRILRGGGDTAEESGAAERSRCGAHLKCETVHIGGGRGERCAVSHEKLTRKHNPECTCELLPRRQDGTANACVLHRQIAQDNTRRNGNHCAVADTEDKQREDDKGNRSGQARDCTKQHGEDTRAGTDRSADQYARRRELPHECGACGRGEDESSADRHKDEPRRLWCEFTDILQVETEHDKEGDNGGVQAYIEKNSDRIATITKEPKRISKLLLVCPMCSVLACGQRPAANAGDQADWHVGKENHAPTESEEIPCGNPAAEYLPHDLPESDGYAECG